MPVAKPAHTPIRSRVQGRTFTFEERVARLEAFDVAVAAQELAQLCCLHGERYRERRVREVQFAALEFLEGLDELVGAE